ncbi:rhodanese-like domain-containing protein [Agarivorans litoreus]|uniref:rhodanese-like domain-containing protein n=1 Tax=Agarivorans litoreus TaxID=1510455 RepID=UPI001C7CFBBF|nr:rhodanese-like domain-containing protein [Agarivorans litoreus]
MFKKMMIIATLIFAPLSLMAEEVVGKIQSISQSAKIIQYLNPKTKQVKVIKFNEDTTLVDAESFKDLTVNTKFKAEVNDDNLASSIKRILVKLPDELVIDTDELADLLESGEPVFVGDARPLAIYQQGHIPSAKATPSNKLEDNLDWLPKDKSQLVVFYCGGVTCPLSPKALKIAKAMGYTNVKAYVQGYPAWKAEVYPTHVNPKWLMQNLDKHHVILDVRTKPSSSVAGAVSLPSDQLLAMHQKMNQEKVAIGQRTIFNLRDKKAPIIIVADADDTDEAIEAYEILSFWKFKNVSILKGGLNQWAAENLPSGEVLNQLVYEKKQAKGAIDEKEFVKAAKQGTATIIDVRDSEELSHGRVKGSIHIPLAELDQNLAQIPKDSLVIFHCAGGSRASLAYTLLTNKGYTNVSFLNDSFADVAKDNGIELL